MPSDLRGVVYIGWAREDRAHDMLVKTLAQRVVVEGASWPIADTLEQMWSWAGPNGEREFKIGTDVEPVGPGRSGRRLRRHGRIAGQPLAPEAGMYRKLLLAFEQATPRPELVILARDGDRRSEDRRRGFEQVVQNLQWSFAVILAMPEPESEAWFLCGFVPMSNVERAQHQALRTALSFDPITQPHRLTSQPADAHTDAKRVAKAILGDEIERRESCLDTALEVLARNGELAGLARLIDDLGQHLLPRLDPGADAARAAPSSD
jgi:hypothetical protein